MTVNKHHRRINDRENVCSSSASRCRFEVDLPCSTDMVQNPRHQASAALVAFEVQDLDVETRRISDE